jgi:hypothetical protein
MNLQPVVSTAPHALAEPVAVVVPVGAIIRDLCPDASAPWMCRYNGAWILRADWDRPVDVGDRVEWVQVTGNDRLVQTVLTVAVIAAATFLTGGAGGAISSSLLAGLAGAAVSIVGMALINSAFGPEASAGGMNGPAASPTYSASLGGNQARIDQPIPDAFGYNRHWPDFAAQPYAEFDSAGDQLYHALLCIGEGSFSIKRILLDDTPLRNFAGVTWRVLAPGVAPTLVNPQVVTSAEVGGQELLTNQITGPISACGPRRRATEIGIDIVCPALGVAQPDGSLAERSVSFRVDAQQIDNFGQPTGLWVTVGSETITAASISPVRRSFRYALGGAVRPLVRLTRTDEQSEDHRVYDDMTWVGLRAYLSDPAPLSATATHLEIRIKANEQLTGLSQRRIAVTAHRLVRTWSPSGGWTAPVETRNPAWALAHKWTDPVSGDGRPDSGIDLATLYALAQVWEARQDRFDYVFDTRQDSRRADQLIARSGRAVVFERCGILTLIRDQWDPLPSRAFTSRNIVEDSWRSSFELPRSDSPQGIKLEYLDYRSWDWETIEFPMPGHVSGPSTRWEIIRMPGIIGPTQLRREGRHMAAALIYRRERVEFTAEAESAMLEFNAAIRYAPPSAQWASSGDVVSWDAGGRVAVLSEPAGMSAGVIVLVDRFGVATQPIAFTGSAASFTVTLAAAPGIDIVTTDPDRERTRYLLGTADAVGQIVRVRAVSPVLREFATAPRATITGVVDAEAVHTVDVPLLPAPGVIQDPIDAGDDQAGTGSTPTPAPGAGAIARLFGGSFANTAFGVGTYYAGVRLGIDGRLYGFAEVGSVGPWGAQPGEWLNLAPVGATVADDFAVLAEVVGAGAVTGSAVGEWLAMDQVREWVATNAEVSLRLTVRDVATATVQATGVYFLGAVAGPDPGAGGGAGG